MSNRLLFGHAIRSEPRQLRQPPQPSLWDAMRAAWRRHNSRRRIATLDSHMLKDIGVTFAEAEVEANKPFWRS